MRSPLDAHTNEAMPAARKRWNTRATATPPDLSRELTAALAQVEAERDEHDTKRFHRLCHKIESTQEACKGLRAALDEEVPARKSAETMLDRAEFLREEAEKGLTAAQAEANRLRCDLADVLNAGRVGPVITNAARRFVLQCIDRRIGLTRGQMDDWQRSYRSDAKARVADLARELEAQEGYRAALVSALSHAEAAGGEANAPIPE